MCAKYVAGKILSINIGKVKGEPKDAVASALLRVDHGVEGDVHAGSPLRQVSLLSVETMRRFEEEGSQGLKVRPGIFAENLTTQGLDLSCLEIGDRLCVGSGAVLEVVQIGKDCHGVCAILRSVGRCVMPQEGIFARVVQGGIIGPGDRIEIKKGMSL